jgi:hypothetical protein
VLLHRREIVDEERWRDAQPKVPEAQGASVKAPRGKPSPFDEKTGRVPDALEGEDLKVLQASAGQTTQQAMTGFTKDRWSGGKQLFWTSGKPGDRLELGLPVSEAGTYQIAAAFTLARDYAIVHVSLDGEPLGAPLDLYNYPDVMTTGMLEFGERELAAGAHRLTLEIAGANPAAVKAYMVGLDYVRLKRK